MNLNKFSFVKFLFEFTVWRTQGYGRKHKHQRILGAMPKRNA